MPVSSTPSAPAPSRVVTPMRSVGPSLEMGISSTPEASNTRRNMSAERLFHEPIFTQSKDEKMIVVMGRQQHESHNGTTIEEQLQTPPTWRDSVESYAALTQIQPGDTFKQGELVVEHEGRKYTVNSVDPVRDADGHTRLRVGSGSNDCLILEDLVQTTRQEAITQIDALPSEEQTAETRFASAHMKGELIDPALTKEVAQSLGFVTPDAILEIAKGRVGPDGKPLLTESDLRVLSGQKAEPTPPVDGDTPEATPEVPQPELSETAKKLQEIFKDDQALDVDQVKNALFAVGIPTNSSQVRDVLRDSQNELASKQDELDRFTHNGEEDKLKWLQAQKDRIKQLQDTVASYTKLNEALVEETGTVAFDTVASYYDIVQNGGGDAQFLETFTTAIKDPTIDNIAKFDESYAVRAGEHRVEGQTKKMKAFLKKFVAGVGLGAGGLMALNLWRASKKDEK